MTYCRDHRLILYLLAVAAGTGIIDLVTNPVLITATAKIVTSIGLFP